MKHKYLFIFILLLLLGGCNNSKQIYTLSYSQCTLLPQHDLVFSLDITFTESSNYSSLDLPVFKLKTNKNSYILNYPMTLAQDLSTGLIYNISEDLREVLLLHKEALNLGIFGESIEWKDVDKIFPLYSKAIVKDLETQLYYSVQRRGGNLHADIQPLTKLDTENMYRAYNNKWSWDRRAVVLKVGDQYIAGSINGMPHGAGAIQDNDFDGHSCVHFLNSKVHGSNNIDFAHQLMISKASGQLFDNLISMEPEDILKAFIVFSTQEQEHLTKYILLNPDSDTSFFQTLQSVQLGDTTTIIDEVEYKRLEVETMYYFENKRYVELLTFDFYKKEHHLTWKIEFIK